MRRRASVTLEFALAAPVLVLLLVGVVEWGVVFAQEVAVVGVAREAASTAARVRRDADPNPAVVARARALAALPGAGLPAAGTGVIAQVEPSEHGWVVRVELRVPRDPLFNLLPSPTQLRAETVMRMEHQ